MAEDPVLAAIQTKLTAIGYTVKLSTAEQIRSYDETNLPLVLLGSLKRPTVGWISTSQGGGTRLYRMILVQKNDLQASLPLQSTGLEYQFKNDVLANFQGINYTTFAGTPAWDSKVLDDENFDAGKAAIGYLYSSILVSVECLEVTTVN